MFCLSYVVYIKNLVPASPGVILWVPMFARLKHLFARASGYGLIGFSTFMLDMAVLSFLYYKAGTSYSFAMAIGFFIGVSLNYIFSYFTVFSDTKRSFIRGYLNFVSIATVSLILISTGVFLLTNWYNMPIMIARVLSGATVGCMSFLTNSLLNFKIKLL